MRRRGFMLLGCAAVAAAFDTPRNAVARSANRFHDQYKVWAARMNAGNEAGTICADCVESWGSLPKLWRALEHAWKEWVRTWA